MRGKYLKLLCFLIISFFMIGFGGEVKAEGHTLTINSYQYLGDYNTARYAWFRASLDGVSRYAYCLDAPNEAPPYGSSFYDVSNYLSTNTELKMINVLVAAGYPSYNLTYTDGGQMSEADAFYVTQAALWYARYGSAATYRTFTPNFHQKMKNGTYGLYKYKTAYNKLIAAADNLSAYDSSETKIGLNVSNENTMSEETIGESNKVLVSNSTFSVNVASVIEVTGTNASIYSEDLTQNYGTSRSVAKDEKFKIVIDVDDTAPASEYNASFSVTETNPKTKYQMLTFPALSTSGYQGMGLLLPLGSTPANLNYSLKGNTEDHEFSVQFAKVNNDGEYLDEAILEVYTSENDLITILNSSADGPVPVGGLKLVPGDYYVKEVTNPGGYTLNTVPVDFTVAADGKISVDGNVVDVVSISDENAFISFKKVDIDGNNVAGATFVIYRASNAGEHGSYSDNYVCGKTDADGYLTQVSSACDNIGTEYGTNNILSPTGVYKLTDFNYSNYPSKGRLWVKELEAAYGYEKDENAYILVGPLNNRIGWYSGGVPGDVIKNPISGITEFQFKNARYIDISKVDSIGGEEIEGAELRICIKNSATGECETKGSGDDKQNDYVDSWTSGTTPHRFVGIEKNVRYILEEVYAPSGYVLFSGMLEFELVDDQGTVEMYNHSTGEKIDNPEKLKAVMPNKPTETYFSKTSATTGKEIAGAKLKVCTESSYKKDGSDCTPDKKEWSWTSEEGKTHVIKSLASGKYYLIEELAPEGYVKQTNAVTFTVKEDGSVDPVNMTNEPTKLLISKKDITTGEEVPGAKIKICTLDSYKKDGSDCTPDKDEWSWTSGTESKKIEALPFGDYVLIETLPSEGYEEGMIIDGNLMTAYEFTISQENNNIKIDVYNQLLTDVPSTGISTLNLFAIGGLLVFAGYETIKIYRRKALNN